MDELDRSIERIAQQLRRIQNELQRAGLLPGKGPVPVQHWVFARHWSGLRERVQSLFHQDNGHNGHALAHAPRPD